MYNEASNTAVEASDTLVEVSDTAVETSNQPWYCYILRNTKPEFQHLTYNGSTNNLKRRLRQHNGEISGGARYTSRCKGGWVFYAVVSGFKDHKNALSCEWVIKHTNGKPGVRPKEHQGMIGRIRGLHHILHLPKWTKPCTIMNSECKYTVWLAKDVLPFFDIKSVLDSGNNIEVFDLQSLCQQFSIAH